MTTIKCEINETINITISGHAGYAPAGKDIVCSAVSILSMTLLQKLIELGIEPEHEIKSGLVKISFRETGETLAIWDTIMCGFRILEENFPKNIKILGKNRGK